MVAYAVIVTKKYCYQEKGKCVRKLVVNDRRLMNMFVANHIRIIIRDKNSFQDMNALKIITKIIKKGFSNVIVEMQKSKEIIMVNVGLDAIKNMMKSS